MGMTCIIAEKPSVARELAAIVGADSRENGYMEGNNYIVTWAIGHLVTLAMPQQYGVEGFRKEDLPLLPEPFRLIVRQIRKDGEYINDPAAVKQLGIIKNCFNRSEKIIVATDAGREGELIFRYIYSYLNSDKPYVRLWISSLTDKAIKEGLSKLRPGNEFDNLYSAGKARSEADWLVGINASRALSISAGKNGFSLGRVQTPTLSIICRRYIENKQFKSVPYWKLEAMLDKDGVLWKAVSETTFERRETAQSAVKAILADNITTDGHGCLSVLKVERKAVRTEPPLLYDLTTLQKEANRKYSFSADTTLSLAQSLYEKKLITYPRTGSRYIGDDVFDEISGLIEFSKDGFGFENIVPEILKHELNRRSVDASKVTDHHALLITGNKPEQLSANEDKIYRMIMARMLEAFSETSQKDVLTVTLRGADVDFVLKAEKVTYPGWKVVLNEKEEDEDKEVEFLPDFKEGENIRISSLKETEHKTKPKPLFTEATLLSAMENAGREIEDGEVRKAMDGCGIGTPATRANIIETLLLREYIRREKKTLVPTDKGMAVYDIVKDKRIANAEMTGMWELSLAKIENGENDAARFNQEIKDYTGRICTELLESSIVSKDNTELLTCPVCKNNSVKIYPKVAKCTSEGCEFRIFREVCGKILTDKEVRSLITQGHTTTLKGRVSKAGKKFNAVLILKEDGSTSFEFKNNK